MGPWLSHLPTTPIPPAMGPWQSHTTTTPIPPVMGPWQSHTPTTHIPPVMGQWQSHTPTTPHPPGMAPWQSHMHPPPTTPHIRSGRCNGHASWGSASWGGIYIHMRHSLMLYIYIYICTYGAQPHEWGHGGATHPLPPSPPKPYQRRCTHAAAHFPRKLPAAALCH